MQLFFNKVSTGEVTVLPTNEYVWWGRNAAVESWVLGTGDYPFGEVKIRSCKIQKKEFYF